MADYAGDMSIVLEVMDENQNTALVRVNLFSPTIDSIAGSIGGLATAIYGGVGGTGKVVNALSALTNAKIVRAGFTASFDFAARPATESGAYKWVWQHARTTWLDGLGGRASLSIPAPVDGLFLAAAPALTTVDPANTNLAALVTAVQAAATAGSLTTRSGGTPLAQFTGGQLVQGKPPRRRHTLGQ
jgi:hypothetical protein